jgi:hypothetical protein
VGNAEANFAVKEPESQPRWLDRKPGWKRSSDLQPAAPVPVVADDVVQIGLAGAHREHERGADPVGRPVVREL